MLIPEKKGSDAKPREFRGRTNIKGIGRKGKALKTGKEKKKTKKMR